MRMFRMIRPGFGMLGILMLSSCNPAREPVSSSFSPDAGWIEVDLQKTDPERLLRYYMGAYAGPNGGDPYQAGLLLDRRGQLFANLPGLAGIVKDSSRWLKDDDSDGTIGWDEFERFLQGSYYSTRKFPTTWESFSSRFPYDRDPSWISWEIHGVVSLLPRRIYVREDALLDALENYEKNGGKIIYREGTIFIADHLDGGERVETTVMEKRGGDGQWDFYIYDREGHLAGQTQTSVRPLRAPTQCVGCHFGKKKFEPEKSFPGEARSSGEGARRIYVGEGERSSRVTAFFDEHSRRSDHVLGLYATLYVSRLLSMPTLAGLTERQRGVLERLGIGRP